MKGFTLYSFIRIALKHIVILIASGLVFAIGTYCYCEFVALPVYSAKASFVVTSGTLSTNEEGESDIENTDIVASRNLGDTVIDILNTKDVYKKLSNETGNKYNYKNLKARTSIHTSDNSSLFIYVSFTANDPAEAIEFVNHFVTLAPERIQEEISGCEARIMEFADGASKTYPRTNSFILLAFMVGAAAAYGILLLIYSTNTIIRSDEDFRERFDIEIIGLIPDFARAKHDRYYYKSSYYGKGGKEDGK